MTGNNRNIGNHILIFAAAAGMWAFFTINSVITLRNVLNGALSARGNGIAQAVARAAFAPLSLKDRKALDNIPAFYADEPDIVSLEVEEKAGKLRVRRSWPEPPGGEHFVAEAPVLPPPGYAGPAFSAGGRAGTVRVVMSGRRAGRELRAVILKTAAGGALLVIGIVAACLLLARNTARRPEPAGAAGTAGDTKRKEEAEPAPATEQKYAAIINALSDIFYAFDKSGKMLEWNEEVVRVSGYSNEEIGNSNALDYFVEEDKKAVLEGINRVFKEGRAVAQGRFLTNRGKGSAPYLLSGAILKDGKGNVIGMTGVGRDITEIKKAEAELAARTEALLRSNQELEQFAYMVSHDLQTPLRAVDCYVQLLKESCQGRLDAEADKLIDSAAGAVARMQTLIRDLLEYSRVGKAEPADVPVNLGTVVNAVADSLRKTIGETGAVLKVEPLPTVPGSPVRMAQLFENLIGNALKYRGARPPEIRIRAEEREAEWVISVQDNGIGMEPQYFVRIFEAFQRLHAREYSGTGIGLAVCKKIVELLGGRIWVESRPGEGSTFSFSLPRRRQ